MIYEEKIYLLTKIGHHRKNNNWQNRRILKSYYMDGKFAQRKIKF